MSTPAGRHGENGEPDLNAIAAWVDGRLDPRGRADLTAHLASCAECRAIVAELSRGAAPAAASWRPMLALAATIAVAAIGGSAYFIVQQRERPSAAAPAVLRPVTPAPTSAPRPSVPTVEPSRPSAPPAPADRKRAAGTTSLAGKTFHLVAGEWIDDAYRESDFLPVVEVSSRQQLDSIAPLRRYASLGSRFTVVIQGTVYRVVLP